MEITLMKCEEKRKLLRDQRGGELCNESKKNEYAPPTNKEFMNGMRAATVRQQTVKQY